MFCPCETRTSTCRSFATISSGLYRFLAITVLLDVKDITQVGPLQWGWIRPGHTLSDGPCWLACLECWRNDDQQALRGVFETGLHMNAVDPEVDVAFDSPQSPRNCR